MNAAAGAILAMIQTGLPEVACFITTTMADGTPTSRQVSPFVSDDWTMELLSRQSVFKVAHLRRQPRLSCLWVQLLPARPARTVLVHGTATIVTDPAGLHDFYRRRAAVTGRPEQQADDRCVIRIRPDFLRAEKFAGDDRSNPLLIRDFSTAALIPTHDPLTSPRPG